LNTTITITVGDLLSFHWDTATPVNIYGPCNCNGVRPADASQLVDVDYSDEFVLATAQRKDIVKQYNFVGTARRCQCGLPPSDTCLDTATMVLLVCKDRSHGLFVPGNFEYVSFSHPNLNIIVIVESSPSLCRPLAFNLAQSNIFPKVLVALVSFALNCLPHTPCLQDTAISNLDTLVRSGRPWDVIAIELASSSTRTSERVKVSKPSFLLPLA
jgi:hypothetical protein